MAKMKTSMNPHFSNNHQNWATPWELFRQIDSKYGPCTLDVCAMPETAKCDAFFTPEQDGLRQEWHGVCWMNPPYGRDISRWLQKVWLEVYTLENAVRAICLLPARTDTKWWHEYVIKATICEFIRGRVKFQGAKHNAPFPSAIVVFGGSGQKGFRAKRSGEEERLPAS